MRALGTLLAALLLTASAAAQHSGDVWVGRTADGQLTLGGFDPDTGVTILPAVDGLLKGWSDNSRGFDRVVVADAEQDLYPLESGAQIWLRILAIDPALQLIDKSFQILDTPGDETLLGDWLLHEHPTWLINRISDAYDPEQVFWTVTLVLEDRGGTGYADSPEFTMIFYPDCHIGDINADGDVDTFDIDAFIAIVSDPSAANEMQRCRADCNRDGQVDTFDIDAFIELVSG